LKAFALFSTTNTSTNSSSENEQTISTPNNQSNQLTNAVKMFVHKYLALVTFLVLVLASSVSTVAINPDFNNANVIALQDDVSSTVDDSFATEADFKRYLADHEDSRNLTLMARGYGDLISPNPAVGDVSIASSFYESHKTEVIVSSTDKESKDWWLVRPRPRSELACLQWQTHPRWH
jgi:hypothetical protein